MHREEQRNSLKRVGALAPLPDPQRWLGEACCSHKGLSCLARDGRQEEVLPVLNVGVTKSEGYESQVMGQFLSAEYFHLSTFYVTPNAVRCQAEFIQDLFGMLTNFGATSLFLTLSRGL